MTNWLITGGAGFIGSVFTNLAFNRTDVKLIVLDCLSYAGDLKRLEHLLEFKERIEFVHGDIRDGEALKSLFEKYHFERVIHFAAESHVDRSISNPNIFAMTNVIGTMNLLNSALHCWHQDFENKLFIHVSTDEVFGSLSLEDPPFHESSPYLPNSPYAASKASSDHFVRAYHETYSLPCVITNCSNNYGPWQYPEKLIPLMIQNALERKPLPIYGDGQQIRDWIHVNDHCEALLKVMDRGVSGRTYLIGSENEISNLKMVEMICSVIDEIEGRSHGDTSDLIRFVQDRPGHDQRYAIDAARTRAELQWKPVEDFQAALHSLVLWMKEHQDWIQSKRNEDYKTYYLKNYGMEL